MEEKKRSGVPKGLPIAAVVLLVLGLAAGPFVQARYTEQDLARNVIIAAMPFILIFVSIILWFMTLVWFVASRLNDNIDPNRYRPVELALIAGIVLGAAFMFQPWFFPLFKWGFLLLLVCTLGFILWSHIRPAPRELEVE